jgi:nucleoside-diphosphate-sugar epimerase
MRVMVIGASGAIGSRLVPQLQARGHDVIGTATSLERAARVEALGAEPLVLDVLDAGAVLEAVREAYPDAIVHQATALGNVRFSKKPDRTFERTNRLRTEGTDNLLAAAREVGVQRLVAQSFANLRHVREGGPVKTEEDPLAAPIEGMDGIFAALAHLERSVTDAGGAVLRYGAFYGADNDGLPEPVRKRQFPIVGDGGGVTSFIHLDDAASATVLALEQGARGIYNVADDEPAPVREWLPLLAEALGAKPPRRFPVWLARRFAGEFGVVMGTEARGVSSEKAKRELGWTLRYPSWRQGFRAAYGSPTSPRPRATAAPVSG